MVTHCGVDVCARGCYFSKIAAIHIISDAVFAWRKPAQLDLP